MKLNIALFALVSTFAFANEPAHTAPAHGAAVKAPATTPAATTEAMAGEASKAVAPTKTAQATCKEGQHMDKKTNTCVDTKKAH